MRRLLILVLLLAVLIGLIFLNRTLAGWHYVLPARGGDLLYVATFDGFNEDWEQYDGRLSAKVTDGALRVTVGEAVAGPYSVTKPFFGDFDVRVQATAVAGPEANGYGIVFGEQDANNFYYFLISSDGYYRVSRIVAGDSRDLSNWIESPVINRGIGATNTLRVVGHGGEFRFFVNDQPLVLCIPDNPDALSTIHPLTGECVGGSMQDALIDASFATGRLGVVAITLQGSEAGVIVDFDNVLVYAPEVGPEVEA